MSIQAKIETVIETVQTKIETAQTKIITAPNDYEQKLCSLDFTKIGGIDEVGRGPLAGPVTACAVILPPGLIIPGANDSKKLSQKQREELAAAIKCQAIDYALGWVDESTIDKINILQATYMAMSRALENLKIKPDALLIDGLKGTWLPDIPYEFIKGGDSKSHSIACASILAKTARDAVMVDYHKKYPQYGFDTNKGYGTTKHREAIRIYGPCPLHRRSFLGGIPL